MRGLFAACRNAVRVRRFAAALRILLAILIPAFTLVSPTVGLALGDRLSATEMRIAGDASRARLVIRLDREPDLNWFLLRGPHRLVLDLPETDFTFARNAPKARGLVRSIRYGQLDEGRSRIIVAAGGPFEAEDVKVMPNEDGEGFRIVADLVSTSEKAFDEALSVQATTTGATVSASKTGRLVAPAQVAEQKKKFTIALDPGHGGIDGGAEGVTGTVEKTVTLNFAKDLAQELGADPRFNVVLTRSGDEFLRLDERVRIARENAANLLISIHADTIRLPKIRGATIYTLSEKASDDEAAALAARENLADEMAGVAVDDEEHHVADILVDLIKRETHGFSMRFARSLVGELSQKVELINNPHRFAGFKVLSAPDVPSVLLELGYLSNPKDEAQLIDPEWRRKAVSGIAAAVRSFADARTAQGG